MTLPPCPIAGHDQPHHWHSLENDQQIWHVDHRDGVPGIVCTKGHGLSRCYSAHVPEPTPDPDEWVRVGVGATIPGGLRYRLESELTSSWMVGDAGFVAYVRRSDLDKLTPPDPAKALAEALTSVGEEVWTAADVRAALKSAGLTLGAEK